jgi:hypothetical protein
MNETKSTLFLLSVPSTMLPMLVFKIFEQFGEIHEVHLTTKFQLGPTSCLAKTSGYVLFKRHDDAVVAKSAHAHIKASWEIDVFDELTDFHGQDMKIDKNRIVDINTLPLTRDPIFLYHTLFPAQYKPLALRTIVYKDYETEFRSMGFAVFRTSEEASFCAKSWNQALTHVGVGRNAGDIKMTVQQ